MKKLVISYMHAYICHNSLAGLDGRYDNTKLSFFVCPIWILGGRRCIITSMRWFVYALGC